MDVTTSRQGPARGPVLRVICVNDIYTLENLPRLKSLVQHHTESHTADRLLVTLAGDFVAPSILSSLDKGVGMIDCLNAIPITHATFGNHEDDVGMAELARRVRELGGTWLNTNMPTFRPELPVHQILDVSSPGGRTIRVGLLGLLAHQKNLYRPGAFGGHVIEPANETAVRWARVLVQEEGCACVIPITHQDQADDHALSSVGIKTRPTSLGSLLCSHIRDALGADGCLLHGGGVRGEREYEERFTYADLKAALPYANETVVVSMPGHVVRDAVAMSRAATGEGVNAYLQVDDRMTVEGPGHTVVAIGGQPLDPEREYRIATVLGLLGGMNGIEPLVQYARDRPERVPPRDSGREIKVILVDAFSMELWRQLGSFEDIDANQDGIVTPEELRSAITRATTEAPSEIVVNDVLRMIDVDGDGTITREEAEAVVAEQSGNHPGSMVSAGAPRPPRGENGQ